MKCVTKFFGILYHCGIHRNDGLSTQYSQESYVLTQSLVTNVSMMLSALCPSTCSFLTQGYTASVSLDRVMLMKMIL